MINIDCLTGETLSFTQYQSFNGADFSNLQLHRALLDGLDISFANFSNSNLRGAFLSNTILSNCIFHNTNLITAFLCNANGNKAQFIGATLFHAKFDGSKLSGANFTDAKADGASFANCNLSGANLSFLSQKEAFFEGAFFDKFTLFCEGFDPINAGMKFI